MSRPASSAPEEPARAPSGWGPTSPRPQRLLPGPRTPTSEPSTDGCGGGEAPPGATKAVGHSILVDAFYILARGVPYDDPGAEFFIRRRPEAQTRKLISQLNALGYTVTLNPLQAA